MVFKGWILEKICPFINLKKKVHICSGYSVL